MKDLALIKPQDLSLVEDNSLNEKQLKQILQKTPPKYVKKRPAKGGGTWDYVTGGYVKKCLNLMFGWDWDFEIIHQEVICDEVVVKGRLTCRTNGKTIVKMQFGNKDVIYKKGTKDPLSIGNDMKSAATDCLKKCAAELGIAADIYNKEDFREVNVDITSADNRVAPSEELFKKIAMRAEIAPDEVNKTINDYKLTKEQISELKFYGVKYKD